LQISRWWQATSDTVRATFTTLLNELDSELPILILATHDKPLDHLAEELSDLFHEEDGEIYHIRCFTEQERRKFFSSLLMQKCLKPPSVRRVIKRELEVLPLAPAPPPRQLSVAEKVKIERKEEATLRELRIFLREILAKLARNKLFYMFTRPVDIEEVPDYLEIIQQPMDLETMMTKIDRYAYESAKDFLTDIELICSNALEYNPNRDAKDKMIRHRACTLRDTAYALIKAEMDTDFEELCQEISRTRKAREEISSPVKVPVPAPAPVLAPVQAPVPAPVLVPALDPNTVPAQTPTSPTVLALPSKPKSPFSSSNIRIVKENGIKFESGLSSVSKIRRKRSSWSRGVIGSRRPSKKGKLEMDCTSSNSSTSINLNGNAIETENDLSATTFPITEDNEAALCDYVTDMNDETDCQEVEVASNCQEVEVVSNCQEVEVVSNCQEAEIASNCLESDATAKCQENGTATSCSMNDTFYEMEESVLDASVMTEATDIAKEPSVSTDVKKVVVIDTIRLEQLLDIVVQKTQNWPFEKILRLHCKFVRTIDQFMKLWNRSSLIQVC